MAENSEKTYEIRVRARLSEDHWRSYFEGVAICPETNGDTVLRARFTDQAALFGLLSRIRNLALPLVSVNLIEDSNL